MLITLEKRGMVIFECLDDQVDTESMPSHSGFSKVQSRNRKPKIKNQKSIIRKSKINALSDCPLRVAVRILYSMLDIQNTKLDPAAGFRFIRSGGGEREGVNILLNMKKKIVSQSSSTLPSVEP